MQLTSGSTVRMQRLYYAFSTGVGAMRRFFGCDDSSFSLSLAWLASRFVPVTLPVALRGVSGGVVMGTPVTLPLFVAAMPGTLPPMRGGLLMTAVEACVATEDVEFDLAGE